MEPFLERSAGTRELLQRKSPSSTAHGLQICHFQSPLQHLPELHQSAAFTVFPVSRNPISDLQADSGRANGLGFAEAHFHILLEKFTAFPKMNRQQEERTQWCPDRWGLGGEAQKVL